MNTSGELNQQSSTQLSQWRFPAFLVLLLLSPLSGLSGGSVTNCTEAALRAAVAGGGTVTFACEGTITLSSTITSDVSLTLDGSGHQVTISGGGSVQVFAVNAGVSLTLIGLGIANGRATSGGGAIDNSGTVSATNCLFSDNGTYGPSPDDGLPAYGGAIRNGGAFNASQCAFVRNRAVGGTGNSGLDGSYLHPPGNARGGGSAYGGAIYNFGTMFIERSLLASNSAAGGAGGNGGNGNLATFYPCPDQSGGIGASAGSGYGGAVFDSGTATMVNCTFTGNLGRGGAGGCGGNGGLINWNPHSATGCPGGSGANGGDGFGAIYHASGQLLLSSCTIAGNSAVLGSGGAAGGGSLGKPSGSPGSDGSAGSGITASSVTLINTLLAANLPGGNSHGSLIDAGHNLSSDGSCSFTNSGSMNNFDPKLGPLANNGGPTLTLALLPGSPAIDAADPTAAPATDQRGINRPIGSAPDIGAFEYGLPAVLRASGSAGTGLDIHASAYPGLTCRLLASSNLLSWTPIATNQIGSDGAALFHDNWASGSACRFYRLVMP